MYSQSASDEVTTDSAPKDLWPLVEFVLGPLEVSALLKLLHIAPQIK